MRLPATPNSDAKHCSAFCRRSVRGTIYVKTSRDSPQGVTGEALFDPTGRPIENFPRGLGVTRLFGGPHQARTSGNNNACSLSALAEVSF